MKTLDTKGASHRIGVRRCFSEESIWREALGPCEPLLVAATYGCLDATNWIPTGGHDNSSACGPRPGMWDFRNKRKAHA